MDARAGRPAGGKGFPAVVVRASWKSHDRPGFGPTPRPPKRHNR